MFVKVLFFSLFLVLQSSFLFPSAMDVEDGFFEEILEPTEVDETYIKINFANVGQGNGVFLQNQANGKVLIIDAGFSSRPSGVTDGKELAKRLLTFLSFSASGISEPVSQPYIVIVSHPDKDHVNLLNQFCETDGLLFLANVQDIYLGGDISHYTKRDAQNLLNHLKLSPKGTGVKILSHLIDDDKVFLNDFQMNIDTPQVMVSTRRPFIMHLLIDSFLSEDQRSRRARLEFLAVNAYSAKSYICTDENSYDECLASANDKNGNDLSSKLDSVNGSSAVVRLSFGAANFIFTGDTNGIAMKRIMEEILAPSKLESRILLASHHGSDAHETNSQAWAAATKPEVVIFSAGFYERYNHPRFQAIVNYLSQMDGQNVQVHPIILHNTSDPGSNFDVLKRYGIFNTAPDEDNPGWVIANTERALYTTSCSPPAQSSISFTVNTEGEIINYPSYNLSNVG